jgi:triosephosphate isomerase
MKRKPLAVGNWKMNLSIPEASRLATDLVKALEDAILDKVDVVLCPAFTLLATVGQAIKGSRIQMGAQNMCWESKGAFTGESSPGMIKETGAHYVLLGHSERRHIFLESDAMIHRKLTAAHANGLKPILCVGEKLDERNQNKTLEVVRNQLSKAFEQMSADQIASTLIAYEPVWAIGTGINATPDQAEEVHATIREQIGKIAGNPVRDSVKILYGGSVTPDNIKGLIAKSNVDGVLVGGASLKADSFERIVHWSTKEN